MIHPSKAAPLLGGQKQPPQQSSPQGGEKQPLPGTKAAGKGGHENLVTQLGFILLANTTQEEKLLR